MPGKERPRADGFTNDGLENALKRRRPRVRSEIARKKPFSLFRRCVQSVRSGIEEQEDAFKGSDLEALLNEPRELVSLAEGRLPESIDDGGAAADADGSAIPAPVRKKTRIARRPFNQIRSGKFLTIGRASDTPSPTLGSG